MIYLDNNATTKVDEKVLEEMLPYLQNDYANPSSMYDFAKKPAAAIREARVKVRDFLGANNEKEIFFTSCGSESANMAIKGVVNCNKEKRHLITTKVEHPCVLNTYKELEKQGYEVDYIGVNAQGELNIEELKSKLRKDTALVSVMYANNEIGTIQPIKELCAVAHENGSLFHTDAVQAVGHIPVDVHDLGIDMLSASAHKFNGPKGVGFLYIRSGLKVMPYSDGGAQEFGLRAGTENVAGIVGMAVALKNNCDALEDNTRSVARLESRLVSLLESTDIKYVRNGGANRLPGLLSLSFPGADGEAVLHRLDLKGICISTGSACNSKNTEISHVLQSIRLDDNYAKGTVRISLGKSNTEEDVETILKALMKIFHT